MIKTKHVKTVTVIDPDTGGEVEVEIRKMESGPMVGIDGSYLEQDVGEVLSPYDNNEVLDIPDNETGCDTNSNAMDFVLLEQADIDEKKFLNCHVEERQGQMWIHPEGFGDCCSEDGHGKPIGIEIWDGEVRVLIWGDINSEDLTHTISLNGASEELRKTGSID
jgi:hypothetical protein